MRKLDRSGKLAHIVSLSRALPAAHRTIHATAHASESWRSRVRPRNPVRTGPATHVQIQPRDSAFAGNHALPIDLAPATGVTGLSFLRTTLYDPNARRAWVTETCLPAGSAFRMSPSVNRHSAPRTIPRISTVEK